MKEVVDTAPGMPEGVILVMLVATSSDPGGNRKQMAALDPPLQLFCVDREVE